MKKIIYLIFVMVLLSMTFVKADSFGKFKQNLPAILSISCQNSTYLNISDIYTNNIIYVNIETVATKSGNVYNYSFLNTTEINIPYYVNFHCDLSGIDTPISSSFIVTPTGEDLDSSKATVYTIMFIGLFLILLITIYGAIAFPWKNNRDEEGNIISINDLKYLKVVLWVFVYLEILFIFMILKNISGFLISDGSYQFFNIIFTLMLIGLLPFFPLLIFFTIVIWLSDKKTQKKLSRGFNVR
jgi:hypothetical protein